LLDQTRHSIFLLSSLPPWKTARETLESGLAQIRLADELGFDAAWVAEHNAREYAIVGSAHVYMAAAIGATSRIRVGSACTRLPVHHPLHLAEDLAMLDQLSGGRVDWGIGKGYDPLEFKSYGMHEDERDARYEEILAIVLAAWTDGEVKFEGRYYSIPHASYEDGVVRVFPSVFQQPHPPVYQMVSGSADSIRRAAGNGHSFILAPTMSRAEIAEKVALYRGEAREAGFGDDHIDERLAASSQLKPLHIAETAERAAAEFERGFMWYMERRDNRGMFGFSKWELPYLDYIENGGITVGSAEKVAEDLSSFRRETGLGGVVSWFDCGGQPQPQVEDAMREYARVLIG